jgi:PAS domain S-box-containing protein
MTIRNGRLHMTGPVERRVTAIDGFLCSLADDLQERSICIILSGTGAHGVLGLKAVKAVGGLALVQHPATAEYEGMPLSALATGLADTILSPEQMPEALLKYLRHAHVDGRSRLEATTAIADHLGQLLALLQTRSKFDLRAYRKDMLARRVQRRMVLHHFDDVADYIEFLPGHADEQELLIKELFVSAARFFWDPEVQDQLARQVISPLVAGKHAAASIRVWVAGCATGEEAYAVAMLLHEQLAVARKTCPVQIFATDIDEDAIAVARQGHYPDSIAAGLAPDRLARFFTRADEHTFQVNKEIRKAVTFAVHNLLSDLPFTKLDLIACSNLLNCLEPDIQKKALALFHFALNETGWLFLSPCETLVPQSDLFEPLTKTGRIYRRVGPWPARGVFPLIAASRGAEQGRAFEKAGVEPGDVPAVTKHLLPVNEELEDAYEQLAISREELQSLNEELSAVNNQLQEKVEELEKANDDMANLLLSTDMATVFLDGDLRLKVFTPAATKLFHLVSSDIGRPLGDIALRFSDVELFSDAQEVLHQLVPREKEVSNAEDCWWVRRIMPYRTRDDRIAGVVITFVDITDRKRAETVVRSLAAIVESSADAIFSKDLDGTIRTWNPGAERVFGYTRDEAVGQSIGITVPPDHRAEWSTSMSRVARGEHVQEETVRVRKDGQRIPVALTYSPIRNAAGQVVSISAIARDISAQKRAEQELQERDERLQAILNTAADAIITIDHRGIIQSVNAATERMFGYSAAEMIGQSVNLLMPSPYREAHDRYLARYLQTGEKHIIGISREVEARRKDGSIFPTDLAVSEIEHLKLFTGIHRDLTERKQLERDVVEAASLEQRRIGQDLHDSVAQELTALTILAKDLAETVQADPASAAPLVERIGQGLQRSQQELRTVLRGLLPVAVDAEGLMAALADLAERTQREGKVACTFDCPAPVSVADNLTATHLYLVAQEAVYNALKHAQAQKVRVALSEEGALSLSVADNGIGMPGPSAEIQGLGLRIMRNRAAIIGAKLTIEPVKPSGTVVTCVLAR